MTDNNNNKTDNTTTNSTSQNDTNQDHDPSRRRFVKNTGMVVGGLAGGSLLGGLLTNQFQSETATAPGEEKEVVDYSETRMFFKRKKDFDILSIATERIFPEDKNGPGAIKLGVPYYIDKQLAGDWGKNTEMYMKTPFQDNEIPLKREQVFLKGVRKMNAESQKQFDDDFDELEKDKQIEVMQLFEDDKVEMELISSADFFEMLKTAVMEGCYSDPIYGGNKNMEGWKMKEYPGVQMSHRDILEEEEFVVIEPKSLKDHESV
ncbi:gluconate 2-dehydrogenase subunit 3 family protein [Lentibacillus salinarum]|uniref:Gluconate 2-dehydrogenase subunit 3 family protein n=1 Tax=Lentibacillus salinarum TaxID=446820 RepID=A0ABW3ZSG1_9BACI